MATPSSRTAATPFRSRLTVLAFAASAICLFPSAPRAGGRLAMPPISETMASHAACVAELARLAEDDRKVAVAKTTAPDGTTREVTFASDGPTRTSPDRVRYEATVWYHHGRPRVDLGQMEISHGFETVSRLCEGAVLTTRSERGFTLATFEPVEK